MAGAGLAGRPGMNGRDRNRRGPKALGDVLGELFAARGYGRLRAVGELETAWETAAGEPARRQTRVAGLRHGILTVTVAHSTLLEELAAFRKSDLLATLRRELPDLKIHDLRFRVGLIDPPGPGAPPRRNRSGP